MQRYLVYLTCKARASGALQPWKWCLISTGYSSLVRHKLSSAHGPRNGLWTRRYCQQAYYSPTSHARPLPRNPCT